MRDVLPAYVRSHHSLNAGPAGLAQMAVAIPARDEEDRIGKCLSAFAAQIDVNLRELAIVVLSNNTTDRTLNVVAQTAEATGLWIDVIDVTLEPDRANAGWARKLAMDHARHLVVDTGVILTTDADTVVDADWVKRALLAIAGGVDAVAGYVTANDVELQQVDPALLEIGAKEWALQHLLAEIDARSDPVPHDPWPRHNQNCGASLAITAAMYDRIGGLPPHAVGEDTALMNKVRAVDGRIRHALDVHVVTSARVVGRASGGMADALRTRGSDDYVCYDVLELARSALRRAQWRASARRAYMNGAILHWCKAHEVDPAALNAVETSQFFGEAWAIIQASHLLLTQQQLRKSQLDDEIASARDIVGKFSL